MSKVRKEDYEKIAAIYNKSGNKAAMEYIMTEYGTKSPRGVLMRIKTSPGFSYDETTKKIIVSQEKEDSLFLGMDELCKKSSLKQYPTVSVQKTYFQKDDALESLYKELLQEKLIEFNKYIKMNRLTNSIYINKTALLADGYNMTML